MLVLVVEDDDGVREGIRRLLAARGYEVAMPVSPPFAQGAINILQGNDVDVMILDLNLGASGFDGFDLARKMRDHPRWKKIPIFISSGLETWQIQERAMEYAFLGLRTINVGKPLDMHVLLNSLAALKAGG